VSVLLVRAYLSAPFVSYHPVHLDSLLLQAHPDCHGKHLAKGEPLPPYPGLPLARLDALGATGFAASAHLLPGVARPGLERFAKRLDASDLHLRERPWNPSAGPERAYCLPVPTTESPWVAWLAVGTRGGVLDLLRRVRQVGGLRRQGYGAVNRWEVVVLSGQAPEGVLVDAAGRAARHLPADWCRPCQGRDWGAVRPPYWHPDTNALRVPLGTACELRPEVLEAVRRWV